MVEIEVTAYADDCLVVGRLELSAGRLADLLASSEHLELRQVTVTALDDGRSLAEAVFKVAVDDLLIVAASGPRGDPQRRIRTRPQPITANVGPYLVRGYIHAPPTVDALATFNRRRIVPLTDATLAYMSGGEVVEEQLEAVLVNRAHVEWVEVTTGTDLKLAKALDLPIALDPRAHDLTGELFV
jgi:hypothetical protein